MRQLRHQRDLSAHRHGFTAVEVLVVVLIVGILAATAITLYLRRTDESHSTEATLNLTSIGNGAQLYFQEQHILEPDTPAVSGTFPRFAQCTSTGNKRGAAEVPDAADFGISTTFSALRWSLTKPHRYKFCYVPDPTDGLLVKGFTAYAVASLGGDSDSVLMLRGDVGPEGQARISGSHPASLADLPAMHSETDPTTPSPSVEAATPGETPPPTVALGGETAPPTAKPTSGSTANADNPNKPSPFGDNVASDNVAQGAANPEDPGQETKTDPSAGQDPSASTHNTSGTAGEKRRGSGGGVPAPVGGGGDEVGGCSVRGLRR